MVTCHCGYLLALRKSTVLLGQFLGQLRHAHAWMLLRVSQPLAHEKAEIRSQRFLWQLWMFDLQRKQKNITSTVKMMKSGKYKMQILTDLHGASHMIPYFLE